MMMMMIALMSVVILILFFLFFFFIVGRAVLAHGVLSIRVIHYGTREASFISKL